MVMTAPVFAKPEDRRRDGWDDPARGRVSWVTLFSSDITPTDAMSAGIADYAPAGGCLRAHRHAEPEIYYIIEGTGIMTIDGVETVVSAGTSIFIPGDAEHGIRNEADTPLRLFYVFPTGSFADVVYRFTGEAGR